MLLSALMEAQINKYYWAVRASAPRQLAKCQATCGRLGRRRGPISQRSRMQLPGQLQLQVGSLQFAVCSVPPPLRMREFEKPGSGEQRFHCRDMGSRGPPGSAVLTLISGWRNEPLLL